jgi:glycosyltransferase involved in cell wall biosynthesis
VHIALISDAYPPMKTSAAVQMFDLAAALSLLDAQVTVVIPDHEAGAGSASTSTDSGVTVVRVPCPKTKDRAYATRMATEWIVPYLMKRELDRQGLLLGELDGVVWYSPSIFFGPLVGALKKANGCPAYLILRDIFPQWALDMGILKPGFASWGLSKVAEAQYRQADVIGVQSAGNLAFFPHPRVSGQRVEVLNNWVRVRSTGGDGIDLTGTALAGRKLLIYTGNMGVAQGADIVLRLAEELQNRCDIGILMVGRGSEANRLAGEAAVRNLDNLLFHPEVDPGRIPDILAQGIAGLVLLDPRHRSQNIPGKAVSYLSHGLPTLAVVDVHSDLANLIRSNSVGCVLDPDQPLGPAAEAFLDQVATDNDASSRCRALADRLFSPEGAARQIMDGLQQASCSNI